jgi:epoxyqueuosine reductase
VGDCHTRVFVDASPLPERAAAVRAGLGFVGKNTNLLTAPVGSWLLLGAILTDLELTPDAPMVRDCGQCRLCLDACPTDAFPAPFVVDANRCISYLTIEHRGPIPRDIRSQLGDHLFGCDDCQTVCPWNRRDRGPGWPEFSGPVEMGHPRLADILALDDAAFRDRYRRTPVWRTKRRGLLRNAAIALGNTGSTADLDALAAALHDAEPLVRGHAAWAIGRIGGPAAAGLLLAAGASEQDAWVLDEITAAHRALDSEAQTRAER